MEEKSKLGSYVWQRFRSRLKTRLLILGIFIVVFLVLRFAVGV